VLLFEATRLRIKKIGDWPEAADVAWEQPLADVTQWRTCLGMAALGLIALGASGCAPERPPLHPVKGQLFWKGQPAAGAVVFFHPVLAKEASGQNPVTERPMGRVGEDGSFEISTFSEKDGAPVGQYRVTLVWTKRTGRNENDEESLLPLEFMDPSRSNLPIVEVREGMNLLPPFKLAP
jgi:hypothetical protein